MPRILPPSALLEYVQANTVISGGDPACVEGIKYDFRLGTRFLKASFGRPMDFKELSAAEKVQARIDPGEVVFVLSEEKITLPNDMVIFLIHKRKISHDGIAVMGGLCVDPQYEGHLLIGLHNFSSEPFALHPGRKLIAGVFERLTDEEISSFPKPIPILDFPDDLIRMIKSYQPINLSHIDERVRALSSELTALKDDLRDDRKWRQDIKSTIDRLIEGLDKEIKAREGQYKEMQDKFDKTSDKIGRIDTQNAEARGSKSILERILFPSNRRGGIRNWWPTNCASKGLDFTKQFLKILLSQHKDDRRIVKYGASQ